MKRYRLRITLLGEFSLLDENSAASTISGDRPITLLTYLLLHRHSAVSRQHLAFTLWPDTSDSQARTNLRNLLHTLRLSLPDADDYLVSDTVTLQWRSDADVWLDVAEYEALMSLADSAESAGEKITHLQTATSLYKGDLLPNNYDDWIIPLREELRQSYTDALHQLVSLLEQSGDYRAAQRVGQRLIQQDPLDETAYVRLMRLHALSGDRAGVRRVYEACAATLRDDLDLEPSPATLTAYQDLLRLDSSVAPAILRPAPITANPLPLPVPGTAFIGRKTELEQIAALLADPACRLLTIVGPGGIGKTRIAIQAAVEQRSLFGDSIAWVALGSVQEPELLAATIAKALNYRLRGVGDVETELISLLSGRKLLLVLDNFEHLLPSAELVTRLLDGTTAVKILITSRQALEVPAEWRYDLGSLPIPDEQAGEATDNSAVRLFVQSGRRVSGVFSPAAKDYPSIIRICQLVGGIPLGLELAASWLRLLSCAEIAKEIEENLDFLTVSHGHILPRHRSLRSVFEYSWNLLEQDAQQVLMRLSIFSGGFSRDAAAEVALANLPQLSALVDRSLVHRLSDGRYNLHNVIRQYSIEKLRADPSTYFETAERHSAYYMDWLQTQSARLRSVEQKDALADIVVRMNNIRMAWQWATEHCSYESLRVAAFPLFYFYEVRGLLSEGESIFRQTVESFESRAETTGSSEQQLAIAAMQIYRAFLGFRQGKIIGADHLLRRTVTEVQELGDDGLLTHGMIYLGVLQWSLGQFEEAVDSLQNALGSASAQDQQWEQAMAQVYLGLICYDRGQLSEALYQLTTVEPLAREIGDPRLLTNHLLIFGRTNLLMGHLGDAEGQLTRCLTMAQETGDPNSITYATLYLGLTKQAQGDLTAARQLIEQSMTLYGEYNDWVGLERTWVSMGYLEIAARNFDAAQSHFLNFLRVKQRVHSVRFVLSAVMGIATCRACKDDAFTALVWTSSVLKHTGLDWEVRQRAEALYPKLTQKLTDDQIAAANCEADQPFEVILAAIAGYHYS